MLKNAKKERLFIFCTYSSYITSRRKSTDFEILTPDGELTFWEYVDFLREVMYEEYVQILRPTLIAMKK